MKTKIKVLLIGYVIIILLMVPIAFAQWPAPPTCTGEMLYNKDFSLGLLGWTRGQRMAWGDLPHYNDDPPQFIAMRCGHVVKQSLNLLPGSYTFKAGMILKNNCITVPGILPDLMNPLMGDCEAIDPSEWNGEHWGSIDLFWRGNRFHSHAIPNGLPHESYYTFEYPFTITAAEIGEFEIVVWSPAFCSLCHYMSTWIFLDWASLCQQPIPTMTPTVTGTPPETSTPTTTPTIYCESTDYPTGTPYPTQTVYPTATDWITPPVYLTPTYPPTYTPYPTCVPTATKTPYASATPFHFGVPLTYTNQFDDLREGMQQFFDSTDGLIGDVSGILISASQAVSDVTSFGITNTITISGTPVTTTSMVETFTENMDALRYVFGWFSVFKSIAPAPFWFLLLCIVWTVFVLAFKYVSVFFTTVLWPLVRTIWDVIIDIWNAIPFI